MITTLPFTLLSRWKSINQSIGSWFLFMWLEHQPWRVWAYWEVESEATCRIWGSSSSLMSVDGLWRCPFSCSSRFLGLEDMVIESLKNDTVIIMMIVSWLTHAYQVFNWLSYGIQSIASTRECRGCGMEHMDKHFSILNFSPFVLLHVLAWCSFFFFLLQVSCNTFRVPVGLKPLYLLLNAWTLDEDRKRIIMWIIQIQKPGSIFWIKYYEPLNSPIRDKESKQQTICILSISPKIWEKQERLDVCPVGLERLSIPPPPMNSPLPFDFKDSTPN
jgi:hypothetical protein